MTQKATSEMVYADPATKYRIQIGGGNVSASANGTAIGNGAQVSAMNGICLSGGQGNGAHVSGSGGIRIGESGLVSGNGAVSIGAYTPQNTTAGKFEIGTTVAWAGYNSSNYRLLTGLYDGQTDHDAVNLGQLNSRVLAGGTSAPTTSTVGTVGALYAYVASGTGHLAICTDDAGGTYTWQTLV